MKRWAAAVVLLLLPWTMAPKIALVPEGEPVSVEAVVSRTTVRPGTPVTAVLFVENVSDATLPSVTLEVQMLLDGEPSKLVPFMSAPKSCTPMQGDGTMIRCAIGALDVGQAKTLRLSARPAAPGKVSYHLNAVVGSLGIATPRIPIDQVVITVTPGARR